MSVRGDGKVVFKLLVIAVTNQVDAWIEGADLEPAVGWDAGAPFGGIIADNVIDSAG